MNVFVCDGHRLKLGDFGIVRQQSDRRGVTARTMTLMTAPSEIVDGAAPKWQARDDVYQVGQLLAMVIKGDARARLRTSDVRTLGCGDDLKEIIYRCIGERRKRYETADELIEALRRPPVVLRAGATVHGSPSSRTNVVVRGRPNKLQAAGRDGGLKLMELKRLRALGHRITVLNEAQFWRLAGGARAR